MNIFEQYGIREVANVTLYGITTNKYDDKVYIPVLHFDTLKVSTLDQTSEQVTARGGLGNMEHVLWNYGKALSFTLEDALYTQASESLMWGGLYGLSKAKIKGRWNPYIYDNNKSYDLIRTINQEEMLRDFNVSRIEDLKENIDYIKVYIPCKEEIGYAYIKIYNSHLKYPNTREVSVDKKYVTRFNQRVRLSLDGENYQELYIYDRDWFANYIRNNMEMVELQINNFENFNNNIIKSNYIENNEIVPLDNINEYKWNNCDVSLLSSSNSFNNIVVADNLNICYHTLDFNSNKRFLFYNNEEEKWQEDIDLSTKVELRVTNIDGDECILTKNIPLGIFYIVEDENYVVPQASNFINPIDTAIENRRIMESIEMLSAKKQFAIDVDKNLKSFNYSQLPEYNKTPLTIFYNPNTMKPYEPNEYALYKENGEKVEGNFKTFRQGENYIKWTRRIAGAGTAIGQTITLNKHNFPYNFKLVGETYIRDRYGEDMHYQIELYNCAILDSISLNLAATGESNTVNIKMKALTDSCGDVGRLTIYNYSKNNYEININDYDISKLDEDFIEQQKIYTTFDILEQLPNILVSDEFKIKILHPKTDTIFCLDQDCQVPIVPEVPITNTTYLRLVTPIGEDWKNMDYEEYYNSIKNKLQKEDLLIAKIDGRNRIQGFVSSEDLENIEFLESTQGGNG